MFNNHSLVPRFETRINPPNPNAGFESLHSAVKPSLPFPPGHKNSTESKTGRAFFESAWGKIKTRNPYKGLNLTVLHDDVLTIEDIAREYSCGSVNMARQVMSQGEALFEAAPGLWLNDDVAERFDYGRRVPGAIAYAKRVAMSEPVKTETFSLLVESAPDVNKLTLSEAANKYFGGSLNGAASHLRDKGLKHARDLSGRYLEKHFR